jgi:hypothetical protein
MRTLIDIGVVNSDGTNEHAITSNNDMEYEPKWIQ